MLQRKAYLAFPIWNAMRTELSRTQCRSLLQVEDETDEKCELILPSKKELLCKQLPLESEPSEHSFKNLKKGRSGR